ncbi:MAG: thiamine biosynthesis protein ApbE [Acuticoccus sp.]
MERPTARRLPDGRLFLSHGPIDLLIGASGEDVAVACAYTAATARFETILGELVAELPALRSVGAPVSGITAQRMAAAVAPHQRRTFVTPMAAVAGAVADEVLDYTVAAAPLSRAIVNNGGDIALHLARAATATARIALADGRSAGRITLAADDGVGGIATSGRHGRSLSLGIADSVTVLAASAAQADAAATLIANAVDLPGHPSVVRVAAETLDPDTDLSGRAVTTDVGPLADDEIGAALGAGRAAAQRMAEAGLIHAAALFLRGQSITVGANTLRLKEISAP